MWERRIGENKSKIDWSLVEANKVADAKYNLHDKLTKALLKVKKLKEAEDKKAQLLKKQCEIHTKV